MKVRLMMFNIVKVASLCTITLLVFNFSEVGEWAYRYIAVSGCDPEEEAVVRVGCGNQSIYPMKEPWWGKVKSIEHRVLGYHTHQQRHQFTVHF